MRKALDEDSVNHIDMIMWLPAGKTSFGEVHNTDKLSRSQADNTIAEKVHWMFKTNTEELNINEIGQYDTAHNGPLGCRELLIRFAHNGPYFARDPVHELLILSNGLYRWRLQLKPTEEPLGADLRRNLAQTFLVSHIYRFFHSDWSKSDIIKNQGDTNRTDWLRSHDRYRGALAFYQRELLFEGPFNISLIPSFFFLSDKEGVLNEFNKDFRMDAILSNTVLYSTPEKYGLTNDPKVEYKILIEHSDKNEDESLLFQQLLIAAEQFLRYSTAVGIMRVLEGVQNVQRELLERGVRRATSLSPSQVRTIGQKEDVEDASDVMIESYFRLLKTKFPVLSWMDVLIDDLVNSSDVFQILAGRRRRIGDDEILVYEKAGHSYRAAKGQFNRVIKLLKSNIDSIESTVSLEHSDSEVRLLADIRRINEFIFERQDDRELSIDEVELNEEERNRLMTGVATIGVIVAAVLGVIPIYKWAVEFVFQWMSTQAFWIPASISFGSFIVIIGIFSFFVSNPQILYARIYYFSRRMFGQKEELEEANVNGPDPFGPERRAMVSLKINKQIKKDEFYEQVRDFWRIGGRAPGHARRIQEVERPRWHSDKFVDRPNEDIKRYKYSLKKTDSGARPVRSRFAIYIEVAEYQKVDSLILRSIDILVYGRTRVKEDSSYLVDRLLSRDFFEDTGYQTELRTELLASIG